jgi:hypothetical protein
MSSSSSSSSSCNAVAKIDDDEFSRHQVNDEERVNVVKDLFIDRIMGHFDKVMDGEIPDTGGGSQLIVENMIKPYILNVAADLILWVHGEIHTTFSEFQPRIDRARDMIKSYPFLRTDPDSLLTTQLFMIDHYEEIANIIFMHP